VAEGWMHSRCWRPKCVPVSRVERISAVQRRTCRLLCQRFAAGSIEIRLKLRFECCSRSIRHPKRPFGEEQGVASAKWQGRQGRKKKMDELGIEPKAFRMRNGRSTTELHALE
jgi:hypothetical protein